MDSRGETGSFQDRPSIILIAGFGDSAEMFERLMETSLAAVFRLVPIDLPGFGGTRPLEGPTTLEALAEFTYARVKAEEARIIVAHSAGSIVASLVAQRTESQIDTIVSLEGNITAEDAYYSGSAADYSNPFEFKRAFLARLEELSRTNPIYERYRSIVGRSDARALWELGCDVRRFSNAQ
jgi:pimeloyl-ACP methyl ester carboxylesterase